MFLTPGNMEIGRVMALAAIVWSGCCSGPARGEKPPPLPSLQQVVKHFDFEQPDAAPNSLPVSFYRHVSAPQGFPPFGAMRLSTVAAYTGKGSFEFELGGGSMSARIPTSIIPILPLTDYAITVKVRTECLEHARARLVAWLHDKTGQPIPESMVQSSLAQTAGQWETLQVEIHGEYADAADLVLDLQVVQPSQVTRQMVDPDQPRLTDVKGKVWFDDVIVAHLPHVNLKMLQSGNLVEQPGRPEFQLLVNELTSEPLTAHVQVFDLDGKTVFESKFPAPRGRQPGTLRLPLERCGWYRVLLHVSSAGGLSRWQWQDFAILPKTAPKTVSAGRFGIALEDYSTSLQPIVPELAAQLHNQTVIVPVWGRADRGKMPPENPAALIEQLLRRDIDLIFALNTVPEELARAAAVQPHEALKLLAQDSRLWQPYLDELLVNFGLEVSRWQIGSPDRAEAFWMENLRATAEAATQSLANFVPKPRLYTTWSIDQQISPENLLPAYAMTIPYETPPQSLPDYTAFLPLSNTNMYATLTPLPSDRCSVRQRVTDLMLRGLHAWRAGFEMITIGAPWRANDAGNALMPDPVFPAWRSLSDHLNGCTFVAEVPLPAGLHCWLLRGQSRDDSLLVAWSDRIALPHSADPHGSFDMELTTGPVNVIDSFGNARVVEPVNGVHRVALSDLPVFIERANLNLVQFRGSVTIEPQFVPAISKVHEHALVLRNPWEVTVSGTIRVVEDDQWKLTPNAQEFTMQAGGEIRLPLNIIPQRSILAGRKRIPAQITINADQTYVMNLVLDMEVGLKNIDLAPTWTITRNSLTGQDDLIVSQAVTNHGESPVHLEVFLLAEGVGQNRRTIPSLGPGETAVRFFHVANGGTLLRGRQVRVGVAERDGLTRLNQLLTISSPAEADSRTDASPPLSE